MSRLSTKQKGARCQKNHGIYNPEKTVCSEIRCNIKGTLDNKISSVQLHHALWRVALAWLGSCSSLWLNVVLLLANLIIVTMGYTLRFTVTLLPSNDAIATLNTTPPRKKPITFAEFLGAVLWLVRLLLLKFVNDPVFWSDLASLVTSAYQQIFTMHTKIPTRQKTQIAMR